MVGVVIACHGRLADELLETARQIVGSLPAFATVGVDAACSSEALRTALAGAIRSVDDGQGVLLLVDLLGGSPCMEGLKLCGDWSMEVLTGVNLPMVLKAHSCTMKGCSLADLAAEVSSHGLKAISRLPPKPTDPH